jgi:capsular exopolysaccharide synthesis family protein
MSSELTGPLAPIGGGSLATVPPGYPPPEALPPLEEQEGGIPWERFLAAIKRYKWLVLSVALVGTVLSVLASRFVKPEYSVTSTIYIEETPRDRGPIRAEELISQAPQWVELLRTNAVLDSVVERQALFVSTGRAKDSALLKGFTLMQRFRPGSYGVERDEASGELRLVMADGTVASRAAAGDSLGREVGFRWVPDVSVLDPGEKIDLEVISPRDASAKLLEHMRVTVAENGNFMRLTMTGENPQRLATVTNDITAQFVNLAADLKRAKLRETARILKEQLEYSAAQLRDAETSLEEFRVRTITLPTDVPVAAGIQLTQPTAIKQYFDDKVRIDSLRRDREALNTALARFQSGSASTDAFLTIPSAQNAKELNRALEELSEAEANLRVLRQRFTEEYRPVHDMQDRVTTLREQTIPGLVLQLSRQMELQETSTEKQITSASRDLQSIPQRTINEQRLTREMQAADQLYRQLSQRYEEAKLAEASALPDVKVLDPAVPPSAPDSNNRLRLIAMGALGSLGLALALAIMLDRLDRRVRYPDQVEKELGLSILGAVPQIRRRGKLAQSPEEAAQVVEAFRTIRLNVTHMLGSSSGPVSLTISSASPGDGKSLVAANLALSFAESGYKVCLVDGDIRRGELHRSFVVERKPGLLDALAGTAQLEHILRSGGHPNLTMIPCGTRFERGPEMLGSDAMVKLMASLQRRFNCVIVDSPPLGAGVDPFVLSTLTRNVVLVVRSGETDREFASAKLKLFERLPVQVLGAVLNDVRAEGAYRHYAYVYGYTADEIAPQKEIGPGATAVAS